MAPATAERILALLERSPFIHTVDITGGAPEFNTSFRLLTKTARALGREVIDRSNLTVLCEPGQEDTAEFLARHGVRIVASLPCYTAENVERQRGEGVFTRSLEALHRLNSLGYGAGDPGRGRRPRATRLWATRARRLPSQRSSKRRLAPRVRISP